MSACENGQIVNTEVLHSLKDGMLPANQKQAIDALLFLSRDAEMNFLQLCMDTELQAEIRNGQ